ncbi:uncharacterized protein LOC135471613 [Liolophura sinensis]|uniref:uncharacterized protein LOC135471613 n=1 Tax=Liolophura sinensis TaxID=3198878 RepID=UPI0031580ACE
MLQRKAGEAKADGSLDGRKVSKMDRGGDGRKVSKVDCGGDGRKVSKMGGSLDGRKVSAVRDSDSPFRNETSATDFDKRSLASAMGTSLAGYLATKRFARKLTSRIGGGSWGKQSRASNVDTLFQKEPTYRLEPRKKFCSGTVRSIIKATLDGRLEGFHYSAQHGAVLSKLLSEEIKDKVKALSLDRYKIVCQVAIGEKAGQCAIVTSRCVWDPNFDNSATYTFETPSVYCTATVFGVYSE